MAHWTKRPAPGLTLAALVGGAAGVAGSLVPTTVVQAPAAPVAITTEDELRAALSPERCGSGCRVELPCRAKIEITRPLDVCLPVALEGCDAGRDDSARTKLVVRGSTLGIALRFGPWCQRRGLGGGAIGARVTGLQVVEASRPALPRLRVGVLVQAPSVTLERVDVLGFGHGILIDAGAKRGAARNLPCGEGGACPAGSTCDRKLCKPDSATNANGWALDGVSIKSTDHAGVLVRGPDSNAGLGSRVSVVHACQRADLVTMGLDLSGWPVDMEPCAGIVDASFLGNTWLAPHVASTAGAPAYAVVGANNRSLVLGAYAEEDAALSIVGPAAQAVGGKSHWASGGGLVASARTIGPAVLVAPTIRARAAPTSGPAAGIAPVLRLEASSSEWWTLDHDARETSPHRGWTRLLWRGASTREVGAMRGGDAR